MKSTLCDLIDLEPLQRKNVSVELSETKQNDLGVWVDPSKQKVIEVSFFSLDNVVVQFDRITPSVEIEIIAERHRSISVQLAPGMQDFEIDIDAEDCLDIDVEIVELSFPNYLPVKGDVLIQGGRKILVRNVKPDGIYFDVVSFSESVSNQYMKYNSFVEQVMRTRPLIKHR